MSLPASPSVTRRSPACMRRMSAISAKMRVWRRLRSWKSGISRWGASPRSRRSTSQRVTIRTPEHSAGESVTSTSHATAMVSAESRPNCTWEPSSLKVSTPKPSTRPMVVKVTGRISARSAPCTPFRSSAARFASELKRAKKWMVSSTAMPRAREPTRLVDGLRVMPERPSVPK